MFDYRALTQSGETVKGEMEAPNEKSAIQRLQAEGLIPIKALPQTAVALPAWQLSIPSRSCRSALTVFTRELATLIEAGEPLEAAMALVADDVGDSRLSGALRRVLVAIRSGYCPEQGARDRG